MTHQTRYSAVLEPARLFKKIEEFLTHHDSPDTPVFHEKITGTLPARLLKVSFYRFFTLNLTCAFTLLPSTLMAHSLTSNSSTVKSTTL
jgi:hypothetical protein